MDITFNLINLLVLIIGWIVIFSINDNEGAGILISLFISIIWLVIWIIIFPVCGVDIHLSLSLSK